MCVYIYSHVHAQTVSFHRTPILQSETVSQWRDVISVRPHSKEWHWGLNLYSFPKGFLYSQLAQLRQTEPLPNEGRILGKNKPHIFFFCWWNDTYSFQPLVFSAPDHTMHAPLACPVQADAGQLAEVACMQLGLAQRNILTWVAQGPVMEGQAVTSAAREFLLANLSTERIVEWMLAIFHKFKSDSWVSGKTATGSVLGIPARNS